MSDYIMSLRRQVGHRPLLQVGASVIVADESGRVLLQRRTDNGCWGYSGGSVEPGEDVEAAAARELREETGLIAREMELFGVFSGESMHYVYPNGDEVSNVELIYLCTDYSGLPEPQDGEIEEIRFFAPEEIDLAMISPPIRPVIQKYIQSVK